MPFYLVTGFYALLLISPGLSFPVSAPGPRPHPRDPLQMPGHADSTVVREALLHLNKLTRTSFLLVHRSTLPRIRTPLLIVPPITVSRVWV